MALAKGNRWNLRSAIWVVVETWSESSSLRSWLLKGAFRARFSSFIPGFIWNWRSSVQAESAINAFSDPSQSCINHNQQGRAPAGWLRSEIRTLSSSDKQRTRRPRYADWGCTRRSCFTKVVAHHMNPIKTNHKRWSRTCSRIWFAHHQEGSSHLHSSHVSPHHFFFLSDACLPCRSQAYARNGSHRLIPILIWG